jgi:hypothetical protein
MATLLLFKAVETDRREWVWIKNDGVVVHDAAKTEGAPQIPLETLSIEAAKERWPDQAERIDHLLGHLRSAIPEPDGPDR